VFHFPLHLLLEPFITLVNIQQLLLKVLPLRRVIFTTVLSKWQLQQLDEICEAPQYQYLWNKCPMRHLRWSLAILLTIQILLDVTLCYWVHSSQHSFVLNFFVIAILQIALNRTIYPSVCMYVTTLDHGKVKTQVSWDVLLCSLVNSYWQFKGTKLFFTCFGIFHSLKILYLQWEFTGQKNFLIRQSNVHKIHLSGTINFVCHRKSHIKLRFFNIPSYFVKIICINPPSYYSNIYNHDFPFRFTSIRSRAQRKEGVLGT